MEKFLLSLCFCPACRAAGDAAGIDMEPLAAAVRRILMHRMRSDDASGSQLDSAENLTTLLVMQPSLQRLIRLRMVTITALVKRLSLESAIMRLAGCTSSFVGSPSNIWMEGISVTELKQMVECFHLLAYASEAGDVNTDLVFFLAMIEDPDLLNLTLNLGLPVTTAFAQAAAKVEFARRQGVRRFSFFNYGFLGDGRLRWIQDLARLVRQASP